MRPSWVEVDLGAIRSNVRAFADLVSPSMLCCVVKADAYGHGDVPVAEAALEAGAAWLAVALVEEAARLREAGIEAPILLLSEPPPEDASQVLGWGVTPTVYTERFAEALATEARLPLAVHLKVDTGMHRVGGEPDEILALARKITAGELGVLSLHGVWTHFAVAEEESDFTASQIRQFQQLTDALVAEGIEPGIRHLANTAGAILHPSSRADMVRVGLGTYGLHPSPLCRQAISLVPAMRVVTHVSHLKRLSAGARPSYGRRRPLPVSSTVATAPIGYADGVPRLLSQGGEVLIRGRRQPFAGTVTMDQIVIDAGEGLVEVGDEVVLLGAQGDSSISADEWAEMNGTISYEIVCGIGPRLPRRYVE